MTLGIKSVFISLQYARQRYRAELSKNCPRGGSAGRARKVPPGEPARSAAPRRVRARVSPAAATARKLRRRRDCANSRASCYTAVGFRQSRYRLYIPARGPFSTSYLLSHLYEETQCAAESGSRGICQSAAPGAFPRSEIKPLARSKYRRRPRGAPRAGIRSPGGIFRKGQFCSSAFRRSRESIMIWPVQDRQWRNSMNTLLHCLPIQTANTPQLPRTPFPVSPFFVPGTKAVAAGARGFRTKAARRRVN